MRPLFHKHNIFTTRQDEAAHLGSGANAWTSRPVLMALGIAGAATAVMFAIGNAKAEHAISNANPADRRGMRKSAVESMPTTTYYALEEEMIYRGFLLPMATSLLGLPLGLAASSALFGLAHGPTPARMVDAGLGGLAYGGLYTLGRVAGGSALGIFAATAAHTAHNLGVKHGMAKRSAPFKRAAGAGR